MTAENEPQPLHPSPPTAEPIPSPTEPHDNVYEPAAQEQYRLWVKQFEQFEPVEEAGLIGRASSG